MLEGVDPRELYGAQDVYLEQIKSLHPTLKIVARGQSLKVLGPEADTQRFAKRMEGLAAYYVKYGHVSAEVIEQCFAGGIAQDDAPVDKDVIVYGNNGTIVRARTVNQQRLVKLYDRNDLLFAVGPAGSGKTYTAIALAVRALKERQVRRIILTRPAVEAGEKLGFLPGDMKEKLDPYLQRHYRRAQSHQAQINRHYAFRSFAFDGVIVPEIPRCRHQLPRNLRLRRNFSRFRARPTFELLRCPKFRRLKCRCEILGTATGHFWSRGQKCPVPAGTEHSASKVTASSPWE